MLATIAAAALIAGPTTGWRFDKEGERCIAVHDFGGRPAGRLIVRARESTDFGVIVSIEVGDAPADWAGQRPILRTTAGDIDSPYSGVVSLPGGGWKIGLPLDPGQTATLADSKDIELRLGNATPVPLTTAPIRPVVDALTLCSDDLVRRWGGDPTALVQGEPNVSVRWFTSGDYPADARRAGAQGRVVFLVSVARSGAIETCKVVASSGSASLDARTCSVALARGRYGAIRSGPERRWAVQTVRWAL